jgi:hypothetical protein
MLQIQEIGTISQRIIQLVDHFCQGNKTAFGRAADIQSGVLAGIVGGRESKPGFEILQKLLTAYPSVNPVWLLFGRGPMLNEETTARLVLSTPDETVPANSNYTPTDEQWAEISKAVVAHLTVKAEASAWESLLERTYHLGDAPTPDRKYDDRLAMRTGINSKKLRQLLVLPVEKGGIRSHQIEGEYWVTEQAVREWFGDPILLA